jgi:hypothetical protein
MSKVEREYCMNGRKELNYHGSIYQNWSEASGVGHFPEWLGKEQELCLHDVIDLLAEQGYRYYERYTVYDGNISQNGES